MATQLQTLQNKIKRRDFLLGVIGLGYVGLPLSLTFLRQDINVLGFDLDAEKIEILREGGSYIKHIDPVYQNSQVCRDHHIGGATLHYINSGIG